MVAEVSDEVRVMPKQRTKVGVGSQTRTTLKISLKLAAMSPDEMQHAERDAREGAVIGLWQAGRLSTREAAEQLGLGYHDFLDLLTQKNVPVVDGNFRVDELNALLQAIQVSQG